MGIRSAISILSNLRKSIPAISEESVSETKDHFMDLNRDQLMEGKNKTGENISPSYLEDPYFKTKEAAMRYSEWKDRITPSSIRPKGVPNLYIVGKFHNSLSPSVSGGKISVQSTFEDANDIENKYDGIYGLNGEKKSVYIKESVRPVFNKKFRNKLRS